MRQRDISIDNLNINTVKMRKGNREEDILSQLIKLTMKEDEMELDILKTIIDNEIKLEDRGFRGSEDELFNKAIEEIGKDEIKEKFEKYSAFITEIEPKITKLENYLDNLRQPTIETTELSEYVSPYELTDFLSVIQLRHELLYDSLYSTRSDSIGKIYTPNCTDIPVQTPVHSKPEHPHFQELYRY